MPSIIGIGVGVALGAVGDEYNRLDTVEIDSSDSSNWVAGISGDTVTLYDRDSQEYKEYIQTVIQNHKKKKRVSGYVAKSAFDSLNIQTVNIPANFAGLEAIDVPTRLENQLFRITEVVENEDYVEVTARHVWYDNLKNFTLWEVAKADKDTDYSAAAVCRNVLNNAISPVNSRVASDCTDTKKGSEFDYKNKNLVECFLDPENGICAKFGLSMIRDNWDFYCLKNVGYDRGFVVENGKNLLGVERTESIENMATRVAPYGKDKSGNIVWLDYNGKKYVDSQYINNYSCPMVELYDTGLKIGEGGVTQQNIQEKLLEAGQKRFSDDKVDIPEVEMTIEFISLGDTEEYVQYRDLDKVYLYDILTVKDSVRGYSYTAQVVGVEHDILTGMLNSVTIGKLDNWDGTRKIATWQVPEVSGENIRLLSIQAGSFAPGAIYGDDIAEAVIAYAHFATATIEALTADSIEAVTAHIHEIIAGSITADDITAGSITTETLAAGAVTAEKIGAEAITTDKLEANAVTAVKIASGAITTEKLDAYAVTSQKIAAEAVTADKIAVGAINADKIDTNAISAINAVLGTADIADARIALADIDFAKVKDLNAQSAYFGQAVIQAGVANKLFIPRLSVDYAQVVSATIGDLVIQATNDNYYKLDVDLDGNVTATQVTPTADEIAAGHTSDGRTIYTATEITASELNTTDIYASHALMDEITANIINTDQLFAREATIAKINAMDLSSNTYIQATIGNWQSGSTITQTIAGLESRVSSLGYGTIYYSTTEPSHSGLVQGDLWVRPLSDHVWDDYISDDWNNLLDEGSWGSVLGAYKIYTWTGQVWKLLFDTTINTEMWTAIEQNSAAILLKANQSTVDILSGEVSEFAATLQVQAQEINAAVSAVNAKTATYVMWADPSTVYTITLGDIWIKTQEDFGRWLETKNSTWQNIKDTYVWRDALGSETYVWNGSDWIVTSDRASEVYQQTMIDQTLTQISLVAETTAELRSDVDSIGYDVYYLSAQLIIANDRILAEVTRATTAEGGKLDKTSQYQTADSIVTAAEHWVAANLASKSWVEQNATGISAYVAEYVGANAYEIKSGIAISAAGIEISGAKYIKIKSGGYFTVDSGKFSIDTSGNVSMNGSVTSTSGSIGGWTLAANRLSSGSGAGYVALDSSTSGTYAIWAGNETAANAAFYVKRNGEAKFAGTISATSGSIGGWTLSASNIHAGSGSSYIAIASSGTYSMWAGAANGAAAPYRLKPDGTVYLTKLIALAEDNTETQVNLRTAGLWKLNYQTIKQATIETDSGGFCTKFTLSNGTTVNFKSAASVYVEAARVATSGSYSDTWTTAVTLSSGVSMTVALRDTYVPLKNVYNTGYNQAIADATLVTRYTREPTSYGGALRKHYYLSGGTYIDIGTGWYKTTTANAYTLPSPIT